MRYRANACTPCEQRAQRTHTDIHPIAMVLTMVSNIDYNINIFVLHLCVFQHDLFSIYLYNMIGSNMIVDVYDNMTV